MIVNLDRRVHFDKKVDAKDARSRAATPSFELRATVWAERVDQVPSRDEALRSGMVQKRSRARFRIRWRDDIEATDRIRDGDEVLQIVGGPAMIGRREWLEVLAESYSTSGGAA